jgi:hypothetical protein
VGTRVCSRAARPSRSPTSRFGKEDGADVFQGFADEPECDFAAEFRASADFAKNVSTPILVRQQLLDAGRPDGKRPSGPSSAAGSTRRSPWSAATRGSWWRTGS